MGNSVRHSAIGRCKRVDLRIHVEDGEYKELAIVGLRLLEVLLLELLGDSHGFNGASVGTVDQEFYPIRWTFLIPLVAFMDCCWSIVDRVVLKLGRLDHRYAQDHGRTGGGLSDLQPRLVGNSVAAGAST